MGVRAALFRAAVTDVTTCLGDRRAGPDPGSGQEREDDPGRAAGNTFQVLRRSLLHGDDTPAMFAAARRLVEARLAEIRANLARETRPAGWPEADTAAPFRKPLPLDAARTSDDTRAEGFRLIAPWVLGEGTELRRVSQAATSDEPLHAELFAMYDRLIASERLPALFRQVWPAAGLEPDEWAGAPAEAAEGETESVYEAASARLALSCFPAGKFPELLGFSLSWIRSEPILAAWPGAESAGGRVRECLEQRGALLAAERPRIEHAVRSYLARFGRDPAEQERRRERIRCGFLLHETLQEEVLGALQRTLRRRPDPAAEFLRLVRAKAPYAQGYHRQIRLGERSLDEWLSDRPIRAPAFLAALAASSWVDRRHPDRSPLLDSLEFGGPMFGVFSPVEQSVVRDWLATLAKPGTVVAAVACVGEEGAMPGGAPSRSPPERATVPPPVEALTHRRLYHALLNIEDHPEVLPLAEQRVVWYLRKAERRWLGRRAFLSYGEARFEAWIAQTYRRQLRSPASARARPRLSRDAYVFGIEQLAPAILVDGAWLQRVAELREDAPDVARRLFTIYADEVGNGSVERNHPAVYRRLLTSLGLELPPVDSPEFAARPDFLDSAFDLPVLMLSIGLLPRRFLPELLGLNLAIELSGLGAAYGRTIRELDYWGIDSQIVRLHQSIDNLAGGHAALAKECVVRHLARVRSLGGEPSVQAHWRRVWNGYGALSAALRSFVFALIASYLPRAAWRALGRRATDA